MPPSEHKRFQETRWTLISRAGRDDEAATEALEELCQRYWFPIYAYVRLSGNKPEDAEDLTQDFFARFFTRRDFRQAKEGNGTFRSYVMRAVKNHLISAHLKATAQRRGGKMTIVSWDQTEAEVRLADVSADGASLGEIFDREWAVTLVTSVMERLRREYADANKSRYFNSLQEAIEGRPEGDFYSRAAKKLDLSDNAVRVAAHRLRVRYRALLRHEVAQLLDHPSEEEIEQEIHYLFKALLGA